MSILELLQTAKHPKRRILLYSRRRYLVYTLLLHALDDLRQLQQISRTGQGLAASHLDERVFRGLVCPFRQKVSDLAVLRTVEQPSMAKSLSVILILKLSPKPRVEGMGDAKSAFSVDTVPCSLPALL